jgi:hypothetical protein
MNRVVNVWLRTERDFLRCLKTISPIDVCTVKGQNYSSSANKKIPVEGYFFLSLFTVHILTPKVVALR